MSHQYRVLITGFGPFSGYSENPSWLAVKPLHNTVIEVEQPSPSVTEPNLQAKISADGQPSHIHITAFLVPVTYKAVLDIVPGLHARPPILLGCGESGDHVPPPANGYDFVIHVGVARGGSLRLEEVGHKFGYKLKDADGQLAPIVSARHTDISTSKADTRYDVALTKEESLRCQYPGNNVREVPIRGFAEGYESFPEKLSTSLDLQNLMQFINLSGIEQICISKDAGHYLCDFIYYCSLAEAKRNTSSDDSGINTRVLFLHCPPVNQPLSTDEVTEAIRRIVTFVCAKHV